MKNLIFAALLALSPTLLIASPIYSCKDASGKATFQQTPCSADKLDSLANTQTSETFKRQEEARQERERLREAEAKQQQQKFQQHREKEAERQIAAEAERSKKEEGNLLSLKECIAGAAEFCEIDSIAYFIKDMRMGTLESVLGVGREQRINGEKSYYYPIKIKSGKYVLQVKYEVNRTKAGEIGQVGNVVSEVNYY